MATQTTGKTLCKYFMSGCCMKGDYCTFSHDWKDKPDMICKYYLKGNCAYGSSCRYDHIKPAHSEEGKSSAAPSKKPLPVSGPVTLPSLSASTKGQGGGAERTDSAFTPSQLIPLRKDPSKNPRKWVQAPEFIPGKAFHGENTSTPTDVLQGSLSLGGAEATAVGGGGGGGESMLAPPFSYSDIAGAGLAKFLDNITPEEAASLLCPFAEMGDCPFGETCEYLHGDLCDMCNRQCLNPFDSEQQKAHRRECLERHEREMERAFQVQGSEGKQCAICMEIVTEKLAMSERRFAILPACEHCFCLTCIRKWRGSTHTKKKTIRACPLCRKVSYFIIPSEVWIQDGKEKLKLIEEYKTNLGKKHCKYFNMGDGTCPFGSSCFYKHVYPDGTKAEDIPRFCTDAEGETKSVRTHTLWDFINRREEDALEESWDDQDDTANTTISTITTDDNDDELPSFIQRELLGDRSWFWLTYEPDEEDLDF